LACVLDTSALLAFLFEEPGQHAVADAITAGAAMCTGNLAEVVTVLVRAGMATDRATRLVSDLPVTRFDLDFDLAVQCGALFAATRSVGLSLGDRMCLALAIREGLPAVTADRTWSTIAQAIGATVDVIR
jgi:ribonuclease VapC